VARSGVVNRFAWLTPSAPAAIALLRLYGEPAILTAVAGRTVAPGRAALVYPAAPGADPIDEAVFLREENERGLLAVHGGPGVRAAVEAALSAHGLQPTETVEDGDALWRRLARVPSPAARDWVLAYGAAPPPFPAAWLERAPVILVAGPSNAGKSTLINAWSGRQRALVDATPGTTRDLVAVETVHRGWVLELLDSAGERADADDLEAAGQALARRARDMADLVLYLLPPDWPAPPPVADLLVVHGKADRRPQPWPELAWADSAHVGPARAEALLAGLADAVLWRLGLAGPDDQ